MRKITVVIFVIFALVGCQRNRPTAVPVEVREVSKMRGDSAVYSPALEGLIASENEELRAWGLYLSARDQVAKMATFGALDALFESEQFFRNDNNSTGLSRVLLIKAHLYWMLGARDEVVPISREAMRLRAEDPLAWATAAGNLSTYLLDLERFEEALILSDTVLAIFKREYDEINPSEAYAVRAQILRGIGGREKEADTLIARALELLYDPKVWEADKANIYFRALDMRFLTQEQVAECIRFAKRLNQFDLEAEARKQFTDYALMNETESEHRDALYQSTALALERTQTLQSAFMEHEVVRNTQVMETLRRQALLRRNWLVVVLFLGSVLVVSVVMVYRNRLNANRATMARREAELALEDYKNKLRPHFLFNQLNNVYGFLAQDRVEAAQTYIGDLGDYLRSLMGVLDRTFATVEEEMAALGGFVLLQQQASYDHVNFRTEISSSVKNALVPSGILQPLVENGFKYAGKASQKGAYIKIVAQQVGKVLEIVVEDSGYGETVRKGGTGHGLTMLEERFASYAKSSRKPGQWKVEKDFGKQKSTVKLTMPFRT